jgi:endonuclease/exonuclease/phosphatase family metal-dependent hydrolase
MIWKKLAHIIFLWTVPCLSIIIVLLVCYFNSDAWYAELMAFTIPPIMVLFGLTCLAMFFIRPHYKSWLPILVLGLLCIKPLIETVAFRFKKDNGQADFTVMSYNVAAFNPVRMVNQQSDSEIYRNLYNWFRNNESPDILCLQEFYHGLADSTDYTLDSIAALGNYKYYYINPRYNEDTDGLFGVITFSKFRAIGAGAIEYGDTLVNKGIYNDFLIDNDTVRVINFQLKSMSIRWQRDNDESKWQNINSNIWNIVSRLIEGHENRKVEVAVVDSFIQNNHFKTIICADLNAVPYSSTYQKINKYYYNAFEKAGTGLGFTYNSFPSVIRIDNQFYDKRLGIEYFLTRDDMEFSDHYPIEAGYYLKSK